LLSSVVASMPVWNFLDPMAIVSISADQGGLGDDSESLEDIVDGNDLSEE